MIQDVIRSYHEITIYVNDGCEYFHVSMKYELSLCEYEHVPKHTECVFVDSKCLKGDSQAVLMLM